MEYPSPYFEKNMKVKREELSKSRELTFLLGFTEQGEITTASFQNLSHILIAGEPEMGETQLLHTILVSLMGSKSQEQIKFFLYDNEIVELYQYNYSPFLLAPVCIEPGKLDGILDWLNMEILQRLKTFSNYGCRNLEEYNCVAVRDKSLTFPHLAIVLNELSSAITTASRTRAMEQILLRGKAAGVHVMAVSNKVTGEKIRPLVDLFPCRIGFPSSSGVLLGDYQARKLEAGEFIFYDTLTKCKKKMHTFYIDRSDLESVLPSPDDVELYIAERKAEEDIKRKTDQKRREEEGKNLYESEEEEMIPAAMDIVLETGQVSVSMLQRRLKIGYSLGARIIDIMEEKGYVGPFQGSKPRCVLITNEQWQRICKGELPAKTIEEDHSQNLPQEQKIQAEKPAQQVIKYEEQRRKKSFFAKILGK